jgi:hypothetical protein
MNVRPEVNLPFAETFENNDLSGNNLFVTNGDFKITWDTIRTGGLSNSTYSGFYKLLNNALRDTADYLYTPFIEVPSGTDSLLFSFAYAYRFRSNTLSDTLLIEFSDNCGGSWNTLFYKGGTDLASFDTSWVNFKPFAPQHWKNFKLNILPQVNGESVIFRFKPINDLGSNLFIDNLFVYSDENPESTSSFPHDAVQVFPNPAGNYVQIKFATPLNRFSTIQIVDAMGKLVKREQVSQQQTELNTSDLSNGIYSLILESETRRYTTRLAIVK